MGNKLGKIIGGCGGIVGILGFAFGMLSIFAPNQFAHIEGALETPAVDNFMENYFPILLIGFFVIIFVLAFSPLIMGGIKKAKIKARLKMNGQKGQAKITNVQDTGITINNNPYVKLILDVNGTRAEVTTLVSRVGIPSTGDVIRVVYDPSDPTVVLPEFEMN